MPRDIVNARITNTFIGREDHNIPTAMITVTDGEGASQGFGGYRIAHKDGGIKFIIGVLDAVGATSWENLDGSMCRIDRLDGRIIAIGHIMENRWFNLSDLDKD